jgi:uncharacterized membrane protein YraQ (UPF0718 family)
MLLDVRACSSGVVPLSILLEALLDTLKMVPFLLLAYVLVGYLEHRYGDRMGHFVARVGRGGPVVGALVGCFPQCGFSVLAAALYTKRLVSGGTLLAVFLATSDEAIPILFALPGKARMVLPLILIKLVLAILAGLAFDRLFRSEHATEAAGHEEGHPEEEEEALHHTACCAHEVSSRPTLLQALVKHPLLHTGKVFGYLLALTVVLNFTLVRIGPERLGAVVGQGSSLQPFLAAVIGLIPNCFASVLLAELYAKSVLSFGALVAGLSVSGGLGLIVLVRENKNWRNTLLIVASLFIASVTWGMVWQRIPWF